MPRGIPGSGPKPVQKKRQRSTSRASSCGSTRSRASSCGSRASSTGRKRAATKKRVSTLASVTGSSSAVNARLANTMSPLTDELHSFQGGMTGYQIPTAKARWTGTADIPASSGGWIAVTSAQTNQDSAANAVLIASNTAYGYSIACGNPFQSATTTAEPVRRVSCALEITYTGRADAASGLIRIGRGGGNTSYDSVGEIVVVGGAGSVHVLLGTDEDVIEVPVAKLALAKSLIIVPRPMSTTATSFQNTTVQVPLTYSTTYDAPWEEVWVTCMGYDASCTFSIRWHEIVEAKCGVSSPFKSFVSPSPQLSLPYKAGESTMFTYAKALANSVGAMFDPSAISKVAVALNGPHGRPMSLA